MGEMERKARYIKNKVTIDNYVNFNHEVICSYVKLIDLFIQDREKQENNYYEIMMCPKKYPGIDSYIICTTKNFNDSAYQIKASSNFDKMTKIEMEHSLKKRGMPVNSKSILSWNFNEKNTFYNISSVKEESIPKLFNKIEKNKKKYSVFYDFLDKVINIVYQDTIMEHETNVVVLRRLQSAMLKKYKYEKQYFITENKRYYNQVI